MNLPHGSAKAVASLPLERTKCAREMFRSMIRKHPVIQCGRSLDTVHGNIEQERECWRVCSVAGLTIVSHRCSTLFVRAKLYTLSLLRSMEDRHHLRSPQHIQTYGRRLIVTELHHFVEEIMDAREDAPQAHSALEIDRSRR